MLVRVKEKVYYAGRERAPGEEFDMDDRESVNIDILCTLGKIERINAPEKNTAGAPPRHETRHAEPEGSAPQEGADKEKEREESDQARRHYRRRDMRAEE